MARLEADVTRVEAKMSIVVEMVRVLSDLRNGRIAQSAADERLAGLNAEHAALRPWEEQL